jgi:hypothetical protein
MAILSGLLLLQTLIVGGKGASATGKPFPFRKFSICFILIIIYFAVMEWIGFYVSSFLFFIAATFILGIKDLTPKRGAVRIGTALVFMVVLFFLFNKLLAVQTPRGILF